ncbi:hypothetical protein BDW59DRAFT_163545 [Aspergillus cavernicola]|uniref:GPI anchored protein n=1 Tax=Aspergillus cavernicola TaxID=176166 RepID=A0ABR4I628_9EURO
MHLLLSSLLALTGLQLVTADHPANARVTQAPTIPKLFRRQNDVCPDGPYTLCNDGFGCCEIGAPCTTIGGEPACDSDCSGLPCGDAGLCCDGLCSSSLGTPICLHMTTGLGEIGDDEDDETLTLDEPTLTTSNPIIATGTGTATATTPTADETSDDLPTIPTPTATGVFSDDEDDEEDDSSTQTSPTTTSSSGDDDSNDSSSDSDSDSDDSNSSSDEETTTGGGDGDGAGMVSVKGSMAMMVLAVVGGVFFLR